MSTIDKVDVRVGLIYADFSKGLGICSKALETFEGRTQSRLSGLEIAAPKLDQGSLGRETAAAISAQDLAGSFGPVFSQLGSALRAAIEPMAATMRSALGSIAKQLTATFDFAKERASIEELARFWSGDLVKMGNQAGAFRKRVQRTLGNSFLTGGSNAIKMPNFEGGGGVGAVKALKDLQGAASGVGKSFSSMGGQVLTAFGVFGLAFKAVDFLKDGVVGAAGLNETLSKTDAILGSSSAGVKKFADDMGSQFGLVKKDTLDVASGFGGIYKGLGRQAGPALENSTKQMTKLAADLSSFANMSFADAGHALRTALSGNESDALKQLGVVTDEDTIKAYAYANGIAKFGSELTNSQKVSARTGVIMNGLSDAQGDLDKTSGSTANQFRKLTGNLTNLATQFGSALIPAIDAGIAVFTDLTGWASRAFASAGDAIGPFIDKIKYGFDIVQAAIQNPKAAFEVFRLTALQALANVGEYLDTFGPNIAIVATYIKDNWMLLLGDAFDWTITALKNLWTNFEAIGKALVDFLANPTAGIQIDWTPLSKGFEATAAKFPELIKPHLTDMSKEIAAAAKPITDAVQAKADKAKAAAEAAAKAAADKAMKVIPDLAKKDKKGKEGPEFAGAAQRGTVEAYSAALAASGKGSRSLEGNTLRMANLQAQALGIQRQMLDEQRRNKTAKDLNMRQT